MKKIIILLALLALSFGTFSCGGGAGSSNEPSGESPGVPFVVKLLPAQYIAQTNAFIYLNAKVLDGNGAPVKNVPVTFTNLSSTGTLISASSSSGGKTTSSSTVANTNSLGIARIKLYSTTDGFATVQAEVNTGAGIKRDRKTLYFTYFSGPFLPYMVLEVVDGELDYYTLFETLTDNQVTVQATVYSPVGLPVYGSVVTFGADWPYKVGSSSACSDGSTECEVTFLNGDTATTDGNGQASVLVQVDPINIRNITSILNITAYADNGAAGLVTLQLLPVFISTVTVSANPSVVEPEGTSKITAAVTLSTGKPAFDGTAVSFTTCDEATCIALPEPECCAGCTAFCGAVTPFAQTTDGAAEADFTAPSTEGICSIIATAGDKCNKTDVTITTALTVLPSETSIVGATGGTRIFNIYSGRPGYTVTSSNPDVAFNDDGAGGGTADDGVKNGTEGGTWTVAASGDPFTVTVPAGAPAGSVTLTVRDSVGATETATLTITAAPAITIVPGSYSVSADLGGAFDFTVTGGAPGYIVTSSNPAAVYDSAPGDGVWTVAASGDSFTVTVPAGACPTSVTLTVYDSAGGNKTATIVIVSSPLNIAPPSASICEKDATCGAGTDSQTFTISGGVGPYSVTSSNVGVIPNPVVAPGPPATFNANAVDDSITADTTITLTVTDSCAATKTVSVSVIDQP